MKAVRLVSTCARGRALLWLCSPAETGTERAKQLWGPSCDMHNDSLVQGWPGDAEGVLSQACENFYRRCLIKTSVQPEGMQFRS